ncbi:SAM-dependent methyltransferase, partial [Streptomyces sp. NPDC059556]|uniref:SAM-dependent methyltransferase n=1 Tax=Streptomyces sp. NPDC059556 TaxID=3346863 RepID=UPI0036A20221
MNPASPTTSPLSPALAGHGHVTFLGAGPGDPGLLTLRAVEALAGADVLIAEPEVLEVVRGHARAGVSTPELTVVVEAATNAGVPGLWDSAHSVKVAARGGRRGV